MVERTPIFSAKGFQLGYIEGNAAFDFNGTERCSYVGATGNLCDLKTGNIVGHVSLDGTFVGATWVSDELFGKPSDAAASHHPARVRGKLGSKNAIAEWPANAATQTMASRPSDAAPRPVNYPDDPENLSTSDQVVDDMRAPLSAPCLESDPRAPGSVIPSADENELLERAMSMIRSALVKGNRDVDA